MRSSLEALIRLQQLDARWEELAAEKEVQPRKLAQRGELISKLAGAIQRQKEQLHQLQLAIDQRDRSFKGAQAKISHLKAQLNQVKTNKEYAALLEQIKGEEMDSTRLEDQVLQAMDQLDKANDELARMQADLELQRAEYEKLSAQNRQLQIEFDEKMAQVARQRKTLAETIASEELSVYERVRQARGSRAIVSVVEGVCQGCNMPVTPQSVNLLLADKGLIRCHHCQRILYLEPTLKESEE